MISLKEKYKKEVVPEMMKALGLKSNMAVPRIEKVVLNIGFGKMISGKTGDERKKILASISNGLELITGQHPITTKSRKSIASFKVRKGVPVGMKVTLRRKKMFDFLERFINITLPRTRDFSGINPESVDQSGNLTMAVKEHISFPEILPEKARRIFSLEITVVTSTDKREQGLELLKLMGLPIKK